jgi:CDP-4-dehydro-6-deoxyglucose reductase
MTFTIEARPGGRRFEATSQDTVLEAALRAGLSPRYRCHNGSCGDCTARLVAGTLGEARFHDHRFSDAEKANGVFLLCCATPASDLVVEMDATSAAGDIPVQRIATRVAKLQPLAADVMSVQLRTPRTQALRFLAGQHVSLEIAGLAPRNKSIASCPCHGTLLDFHIHRTPGDPFAEQVFGRLRMNDAVTVLGPWGEFTLREDAARPMIFIACDTGLAPVKSLIEHAVALEQPHAIHLYWLARRDGGHYLENWCRAMTDALDNFSCALMTGEDIALVALRVLAEHPDIALHDVYACGPDRSMTAAREMLLEHGLPAERWFVDVMEKV